MKNSPSGPRGCHHGTASPAEWAFPTALPRKAPLNTPGTPVLEDFPQNDDEKEKLQRRRSRVFDLQFSTDSPRLLASPSGRNVEVSATMPKFTNTQITEHYSTCIKLSTENKITTKNAFGLHLIDFMSEILKQKDAEPTNFKVAAGTLDASTKIYAVRVDAVHADVYKVLGGLGKDAPPAEEAEDHGADGSATETGTAKKLLLALCFFSFRPVSGVSSAGTGVALSVGIRLWVPPEPPDPETWGDLYSPGDGARARSINTPPQLLDFHICNLRNVCGLSFA